MKRRSTKFNRQFAVLTDSKSNRGILKLAKHTFHTGHAYGPTQGFMQIAELIKGSTTGLGEKQATTTRLQKEPNDNTLHEETSQYITRCIIRRGGSNGRPTEPEHSKQSKHLVTRTKQNAHSNVAYKHTRPRYLAHRHDT